MKIAITPSGGASLAQEPKLLPDHVGTRSVNQKPGRGDSRPWKRPATVANVPSGQRSIYRMGRDAPQKSSYWLSWADDVSVIRGFDPEDADERTYLSGPGGLKWFNKTIALSTTPYPTSVRELSVPVPALPPTISITVGSGTAAIETFYYTYTYVNDIGWESAPATPASADHRNSDTVTVSGFSAPPVGAFGVVKIRVYMTRSGASGDTRAFFLLAEISIATTSAVYSGQRPTEALETAGWLPPPQGIGLTSMWGSMAAMIVGKTVRYCEPGALYAWPPQNEDIFADAPVALAVWRQNLVVLTEGAPHVATGSDPELMQIEPLPLNQRCRAPRGVVAFKHGVCYPSDEGLIYIGDGFTGNLLGPTGGREALMLKEDWLALRPETMIAGQFATWYVCSYDDGAGRKGFVVDTLNPSGIYFLSDGFVACHYDESQNTLFVLTSSGSVQEWDAGASFMTATFKSKVFRAPRPGTMNYGQIVATGWPVRLRMWVDGTLILDDDILDDDIFSLPQGYRAEEFQFEIEHVGAVQGFAVAETVAELRAA